MKNSQIKALCNNVQYNVMLMFGLNEMIFSLSSCLFLIVYIITPSLGSESIKVSDDFVSIHLILCNVTLLMLCTAVIKSNLFMIKTPTHSM